jgi:site-specific recombinase XerD
MNPIDVRNQVIFMLLLDTGLRIGELVSLKKENLHIKEGYAKVIGKGMKERIIPIGNSAQKALQRFLYMYRTQPAITGTDNVFLSKNGSILTANSMKLMFASLAQKSGIKRLHAHLCRHTFATRYLTNGGDIFSLRGILGHTTFEMVNNYLHLTTAQITEQHHKYSPMDRLQGK